MTHFNNPGQNYTHEINGFRYTFYPVANHFEVWQTSGKTSIESGWITDISSDDMTIFLKLSEAKQVALIKRWSRTEGISIGVDYDEGF